MNDPQRSQQIDALYRVFEKAVETNDVAGLLSNFYDKDVVFLGTGLPLSQGPIVSTILEGLCGAAARVKVEQLQTLVIEDGKAMVDFALVHVTTADGSSLTDRSTCVFKKTDNGWRCVADAFIRD
ncbi:MAG: SnoaL-like domain [Pseudomonadota bacterium]|jgi:ketosteroid isomerase-like protein